MLFEIVADFSIVIHEVLPGFLSKHVAAYIRLGLVNKDSLFVDRTIIGSNNNFIIKLHNHFLSPIDFEADLHSTLLNEKNFLDLLKLFEHDLARTYKYRFQLGKNIHNKVSIVLVFPGIELAIRSERESIIYHLVHVLR